MARAVAGEWLADLRANSDNSPDEPYTVALSGGRVAKPLYSEIVKLAKAGGFTPLFSRVHFFWADERCVPPTDPESNYAIAREYLFAPLGIAEGQIHRIRGEGPEPLALSQIVYDIESVARGRDDGQPVLDLVFLGMGEDGHVASLFPGEAEETRESSLIYRAVTAVKPPPRRITLGYRAIIAAREAWVLVGGTGKEKALAESLSPGERTPMGRVLARRVKTRIYTNFEPR